MVEGAYQPSQTINLVKKHNDNNDEECLLSCFSPSRYELWEDDDDYDDLLLAKLHDASIGFHLFYL